MIFSFVSRFFPWRRAGALALLTVATVAYGCGSPDQGSAKSANTAGAIKLNPDDDYKYEGTGSAKRKVELSRRERVKLLHEAAKKSN